MSCLHLCSFDTTRRVDFYACSLLYGFFWARVCRVDMGFLPPKVFLECVVVCSSVSREVILSARDPGEDMLTS